jgi:DNA-directed RNA polymerase sigma subunit (sigma70/sigma32)
MYLGLEVSKSYAKSDIANMLNLSRQRISQILDTSLPSIQNYVSKNYQHLAVNTSSQNTLNFETIYDRNLYIFESYYGLNGKQSKNAEQLAKEFSITPQFVREIIYEYKTNYENEHNSKLSHSRVSSNVYYEDYKESIVNDYYGLNGSKVLDLSEIIIKYNLSLRRGSLYSLIQDIVHTAVAENKLSVDDLAKIQSERHEKKKIQELNKLAYVFNSYYGLNGHENKRKFQLAQEFGVSPSTVEGWISKYKKHLENTSSTEEIVENSKLS